VLDTLDYLQKGGRIGKAQAFLGSVLNVKPILTLQEGEAYPLERQRNRGRALKRLMDLASDMAPVQQLAVIHSTEPERAEELRDSLSHLLSADEVITARFGPVLGTYLGPRALGVAFTRTLDPSALAQ
jgi:DegV family protein with EDD domain